MIDREELDSGYDIPSVLLSPGQRSRKQENWLNFLLTCSQKFLDTISP